MITIHYGSRTTIDTGGLLSPDGQSATTWETAVRRTSTHVIIVTISAIDGQAKQTEYPVLLTDLPLELPNEKIPSTVHGRLNLTPKP